MDDFPESQNVWVEKPDGSPRITPRVEEPPR